MLLPQRNKNVLEATSVTPNLNCVFYVQGDSFMLGFSALGNNEAEVFLLL